MRLVAAQRADRSAHVLQRLPGQRAGIRHRLVSRCRVPAAERLRLLQLNRDGRQVVTEAVVDVPGEPVTLGRGGQLGDLRGVGGELPVRFPQLAQRGLQPDPAGLLAGLLVDAKGERLTPSHAVKKGRRYRYYVSAALITAGAKDDTPSCRLAAQEIEDCVIRILVDALISPAKLLNQFGMTGMPSEQLRKMLGRAGRLAAALRGSMAERAKVVRELVEQVIVDDKRIIIKVWRGALLGGDVPSDQLDQPSASTIELTTAVDGTTVTLAWRDNAQDETGFEIQRRRSGTDAWLPVGSVGANATSYVDEHLAAAADRPRCPRRGGPVRQPRIVVDKPVERRLHDREG